MVDTTGQISVVFDCMTFLGINIIMTMFECTKIITTSIWFVKFKSKLQCKNFVNKQTNGTDLEVEETNGTDLEVEESSDKHNSVA